MLKKLLLFLCILSSPLLAEKKMNLLIINVDDLKPTLGCYGDTVAKTPQIDSLASRGTVMLANYCQQAVCAATRVSMYTGLRPDSTGIQDLNTHMRDINPDVLTLPQYLRKSGYKSVGYGKILHGAKNDDIPYSWDERYDKELSYNSKFKEPVIGKFQSETLHKVLADFKKKNGKFKTSKLLAYLKKSDNYPATEALDLPDDAYADGAIAQGGISALQNFAKSEDPFSLVIGFRKPHLPFAAPKKYWDLYDPSKFELATHRTNSKNGLSYAMHTYGELGSYSGYKLGQVVPEDKQRELIHGYYACVSYVDAQVGKLMAELDRLKLSENTVVVLWGDHGWHLGDHGLWCKHSNFEQATAAPLIIVAPGMTPNQKTRSQTEFVDIFPTVCDLLNLEKPKQLEGVSLVPILKDASKSVKDYSVSQYPRKGKTGYSLRAGRYRAVFWMKKGVMSFTKFSEGLIEGLEIYDYKNDPNETINQAVNPEFLVVKELMIGHLKHYFSQYENPQKTIEMRAKMKQFRRGKK